MKVSGPDCVDSSDVTASAVGTAKAFASGTAEPDTAVKSASKPVKIVDVLITLDFD